MKQVYRYLSLAAIVVAFAAPAGATNFGWSPSGSGVNNQLNDLDHYYYYRWGITGSQATTLYNQLASGDYEITSANLTFTDIWNWIDEPNDQLYVHLLDNPRSGARQYWDNQGYGNAFAGQGVAVGIPWNDPYGGYSRDFDLVLDLVELDLIDTLTNYILGNNSRSYFGFGIDPDCHFWNDGIKFRITTSLIPDEPVPGPEDPVVPEPATIALIGMGLSGVGLVRRRAARRNP